MRKWWRCGLAAVALCLACFDASAEPMDSALEQFHHTAWTRKQGAPAEIMALAQTADGWLWLGTLTGLYRFDGVQFERFEAVSRSVLALLALPDGGLWIGHTSGGATLLDKGRLTRYGKEQGLPPSSLQAFALDRQGRLWASAGEGLYRFEGSRWIDVPVDPVTHPKPVLSVTADRDGSVWVRAGDGIFALRPGASTFERVAKADRISNLAASPDGSVWAAGSGSSPRRLSPAPEATPPLRTSTGQMFFDRRGRLWAGLWPEGLGLLAAGAPVAAFTKAQGLSGKDPLGFTEDHEGTVWLSTESGLDRFRRRKLHGVPLQGSETAAMAAGERGAVWVGRWDAPPARIDGAAVRELGEDNGSRPDRWVCAYRDPRGAVWLCGKSGLLRVTDEKVDRVPYPAALELRPNYVQALAMDRSGALWLAGGRGMLQRLVDGAWTAQGVPVELTASTPLIALATDETGRLWFGYSNNRIAMLEAGKVRMMSAAQGLEVGDVMVMHPRGGRLWVGGSDGVALFENGRFRPVVGTAGAPIRAVSGIVETAGGELWLNGADGITRIPKGELDLLLRDPSHQARFERFDAEDGLDGTAAQVRPLPTAIEGSDRKLWFATSSGIYWIDPANIGRNTLPPPVLIRAVRADDKPFEVAAGVQLPPRTKSLAISYTALSLSIPERVQFRYRLDGVDEGWQDAGTRRQAFYTNLGPGDYRFRVIAANDDGVWNETGASLGFTIEPAFFETAWFRLACVVLALAALHGFYRWRLRLTQLRLQDKLRERLAERERIARELHDTLLQSLSGLILRFEAAAQKLAHSDPVRTLLESALERADHVLVEGRDRVLGLRASADSAKDVADALNEAGRELEQDHPARFSVVREGAPRELHPIVHDEVFHIGREALLNAFRHARARCIELRLAHGSDGLRLSVSDDGCGMDAGILEAGGRPGHWGLAGMRERARKVDGRLEIRSNAQRGTQVELLVPAGQAYREGS